MSLDRSVTHVPGLYQRPYNVRCSGQAIEGSSLRSHSICSLAAELGRYVTTKPRDG